MAAADRERAEHDALERIAATSREALGEIRERVAQLRAGSSGAALELPPTRSLADLPALTETIRRTGVTVDLVQRPISAKLPSSLELAAYQIVQEALTNVMKHAGPGARVNVVVNQQQHAVKLIVRDNGAFDEFGSTAPRVVMLTTFDTDEHLHAALRAGAAGFLLKRALPEEMLAAIRSVANGDAVIASSATRRLLAQITASLPAAAPPEPDPRIDLLTAREREVLVEIASGANHNEIGGNLSMAEGTVKTHIGRLLAKTGSRDRVGLVLFAHDVGLLD